ncbi:MAG: shikimate kinase [Deltaproteobacteria bacterium]|nr:shikimate kinase [Deltaproteobacteria bacterium]TLN05132.1 MAG: shikimate kinase [bacterium]
MKQNVILTGFMGTGKSTVGRVLAAQLKYSFCDLDSLIVEAEGRSINTIFADQGEGYFREVESSLLKDVLQEASQVVSTGGGAILRQENRDLMHKSGVVVNLAASPELILQRLHLDENRPLLRDSKNIAQIQKLLMDRESYYAEADIRIDTDGKNVEDVAREILDFLERGA